MNCAGVCQENECARVCVCSHPLKYYIVSCVHISKHKQRQLRWQKELINVHKSETYLICAGVCKGLEQLYLTAFTHLKHYVCHMHDIHERQRNVLYLEAVLVKANVYWYNLWFCFILYRLLYLRLRICCFSISCIC